MNTRHVKTAFHRALQTLFRTYVVNMPHGYLFWHSLPKEGRYSQLALIRKISHILTKVLFTPHLKNTLLIATLGYSGVPTKLTADLYRWTLRYVYNGNEKNLYTEWYYLMHTHHPHSNKAITSCDMCHEYVPAHLESYHVDNETHLVCSRGTRSNIVLFRVDKVTRCEECDKYTDTLYCVHHKIWLCTHHTLHHIIAKHDARDRDEQEGHIAHAINADTALGTSNIQLIEQLNVMQREAQQRSNGFVHDAQHKMHDAQHKMHDAQHKSEHS